MFNFFQRSIIGRKPHNVMNEIGHNAYVIRLLNDRDTFVHFGEEKGENKVEYVLRKGRTGACVFRMDNAIEFVRTTGKTNLEIVQLQALLKEDEYKNVC